MADYDHFAENYQHWAETTSPYTIVELATFFEVLGPVRGLDVLDVACGEGRLSRMLMQSGAASVRGVDVSAEMIRRADDRGGNVRYQVVDARDDSFRLDDPADLVTAMYLFHYAPSPEDLGRMARFIGRNLKPNGRFVTYTLSPDYDFTTPDHRLIEQCGFGYRQMGGAHCQLVIGDNSVDIWQWSRVDHEAALAGAGLGLITWHPLRAPTARPDVAETLGWYLQRPSCIVLSAIRTVAP